MSLERGPLLKAEILVHGIGAPGQTPVLVDTGHTMGGEPISRMEFQDGGSSVGGFWKPLSNGDPENPAYLFSNGNGLVTWVSG